ncbi:MAG: hypothetical protein IAI50_00370 [Candidatus Eremiobacteraeota bacterium]|nr:hypothetical protein [Candidatus Eremiobacteraeota bacterium]
MTFIAMLVLCCVCRAAGSAQTIRALSSQPPFVMQLAFLMTDGSIMAQSEQGETWYRYVPDINGSYQSGTWSQLASLPKGYDPSAFSSAVLADGRLAIIGGEYNGDSKYPLQLTNLGAIYDPATNVWTPLGHPTGWTYIGDSPSTMMPGGQFFVGQKLTESAAYLTPKTLAWTSVGTTGKADFNSEEGYTLLPDGSILTEDVKDAPNSERYLASQGKWVTAGSTIVDLHSPTPIQGCLRYGPKPADCYYPPGEIGPAMLRPDGTVFATGSGSGANGNGAGHTAIYHTRGSLSGTWTAGPDFPNGDNAGDNFAALLPSGNVLVFGNSGNMYEFNGTQFTGVGSAGGVPLLLPTGQVLMLGNTVVLYTPSGKPQPSWAPTVTTVSKQITRGRTYQIAGTQFNGLSLAMSFGDEFQNATNYPLVRITNAKTHHVFYAKTHDHSSMGVATGSTPESTSFDVPAKMETGASALEVVANGIPSKAVSIVVH